MNRKKIVMIAVLMFCVLSFMSSISVGTWEYKTYDTATKTITIQDTFLGKIADLKLVYNDDYCITDCKAIIEVKPYKSISMSNSQIVFKNWLDQDIDFKYDLEMETTETKIVQKPYMEKTNCKIETVSEKGNSTKKEVCSYTEVMKPETITEIVRRPYNFESQIKPFKLILTGKKNPNSNIEWLPTFLNHEIKEWAWWNSSFTWTFKETYPKAKMTTVWQPVESYINFSLISGADSFCNSSLRLVDKNDNEIPIGVYNLTQDSAMGLVYGATILRFINRTAGEIENFSYYFTKANCSNLGLKPKKYLGYMNNNNTDISWTQTEVASGTTLQVGYRGGEDCFWNFGTRSKETASYIHGNVKYSCKDNAYAGTCHVFNSTNESWSSDTFEGLKVITVCIDTSGSANSWVNRTSYAFQPMIREAWFWTYGYGVGTNWHYHDLTYGAAHSEIAYNSLTKVDSFTNTTNKDNVDEQSEIGVCYYHDTDDYLGYGYILNFSYTNPSYQYMRLVTGNYNGDPTIKLMKYYFNGEIYNGSNGNNYIWMGILPTDYASQFYYMYLNDSGLGKATEFGTAETSNQVPSITLNSPLTQSYLNNTIFLNFTVTDDSSANLDCYTNVDKAETHIGTIANGSEYIETIPVGEKYHTVNVTCYDDSSAKNSSIVYPTIYYWNITGKTYGTSGYELGTSNFQIDFQKVSNISSIEAFLFFNGANESYDSSATSGDIISLSTNKTLDLVLTNYTNTSFAWNYSIVYDNGTSYDNNSISNAFSVFYGFWIASVSADKSQILVGETFNVTAITGNHTGILEPTIKNITILSNGTFYPSSKINPTSWRSAVIGIDYNESFYYKAIYNLSYGGYSFLRNSSDYTMVAYSLAIDNCSDYATKFLQIDFLNETNKEPINQTVEITFSIWNTSYVSNITEYFDSNSTINLCYYPAWSKFTGDGIIEYYSELYPRRRYYYDNAIFDNVSDTLNLYNLPSSLASLINFEIRNEKGILQSDVYLTVQRYYVSDDQYLTVAMGKTDFDGMTSIYLKKNDVWYRYILTKDLQVLRIFTPSYITSDSVALTTQVISYGEWWTYKDNLIYTCYTTNNNQTLVCSMLDTTGTAREGCLVVEEIGVSKNSTRYNSCAKPSSAITFTADLGNTTGKLYHYVLSGNWDNTKYVLMNNMLDFTVKTLLWGMEGIFVSFMLFMVMVGIGLFSPSASIVLGVSAIVISQMAGFTAFTPVGIIGLVVVGIILAFKMRS